MNTDKRPRRTRAIQAKHHNRIVKRTEAAAGRCGQQQDEGITDQILAYKLAWGIYGHLACDGYVPMLNSNIGTDKDAVRKFHQITGAVDSIYLALRGNDFPESHPGVSKKDIDDWHKNNDCN